MIIILFVICNTTDVAGGAGTDDPSGTHGFIYGFWCLCWSSIALFDFVLCLVCPMLPVSLYCSFRRFSLIICFSIFNFICFLCDVLLWFRWKTSVCGLCIARSIAELLVMFHLIIFLRIHVFKFFVSLTKTPNI
jgi:hypothetical protein